MSNKSNVVSIFDKDYVNDDKAFKWCSQDEAKEILQVMNHQEEMFLGGLNDPLMETPLGSYKELRNDFDKVVKAWNKLKLKIIYKAKSTL
jgi:hypothetical protein|tara:strand:- start:267 stop:536 length:270 start_codon:yes stop_codon:yes gene_type:complete